MVVSIPAALQGGAVRVVVVLAAVLAGHFVAAKLSRLVPRLLNRVRDLDRREQERLRGTSKYILYVLDAGFIVGALVLLNAPAATQVYSQVASTAPNLVSSLLVVVLGLIVINLATKAGLDLLRRLGFQSYMRELGMSSAALKVLSAAFKGFLYIVLLQATLSWAGIGDTFVSQLVTASSYAFAFLVAGLVFYGFKDLFTNFSAGLYLKNSSLARPGEKVHLEDGGDGRIRDVSLFSTVVDTDDGYSVLAPNTEIADSRLKFRRSRREVETLDDIKQYFVAEEPELSGPASLEMATAVFGYKLSQEEIRGECNGQGVEPDAMQEAVDDLTDGEVSAGYVNHDEIVDLEQELKAWFSDGGLVVLDMSKESLFPDAPDSRYALAVSVDENEVLVVDPMDDGGVYYAREDELTSAVKDDLGGYMVLAPEYTTAAWRLENGLIYSDVDVYDDLSKNLELRLTRILRQGRILGSATPEPLEKFMKRWRSSEGVDKVWTPRDGDK